MVGEFTKAERTAQEFEDSRGVPPIERTRRATQEAHAPIGGHFASHVMAFSEFADSQIFAAGDSFLPQSAAISVEIEAVCAANAP